MNFTSGQRIKFVNPLQLLTDKPILYVCNVEEMALTKKNAYVDSIKEIAANEKARVLEISASIEADINALETIAEKQSFFTRI